MTSLNPTDLRIVLDTNSLVRGLTNRAAPSAQILRLVETRRITLLLSKAVMKEYREVLNYPDILEQFTTLDPHATELILRRLRYSSDYFAKSTKRFRLDRDQRDEKFLELAIAGRATHIISHDLDLLSLHSDRTEAAKQFRRLLHGTQIIKSADFVQLWIKRN